MKVTEVEHIDYPPQNVVRMDWHIFYIYMPVPKEIHANEMYDSVLYCAN
jgi:hypothetical protein